MDEEWLFEPLNSLHDRDSFSYGESSLDTYLKRQASQDMRRRLAAAFVVCPVAQPTRVAGYFTLSADAVTLNRLPGSALKHLGRYQVVPATLIGRLAVDLQYQGRGVGRHLMQNAYERIKNSAQASAIILVDLLNDDVAAYYERFGFERFEDQKGRMFVTFKKLQEYFQRTLDARSHTS